jgi:hypothetical protein
MSLSAPENTPLQAARLSNGRFSPGHSGNRGGRPRVLAEVQDLARTRSAEAIATLAAIMRDDCTPVIARIAACNSLLDRGFGQPAVAVTVNETRSEEECNRLRQTFEEAIRETQKGLTEAARWTPILVDDKSERF